MRVVFMGTPAFAVPSLRELMEHHEVALVVTQPDRASGRGRETRPSAVKEFALQAGLRVLQPSMLAGEANEAIVAVAADVICVAAFGMLLPRDTLAAAPLGCVNVHASLLPQYRGAAPIQRAILSGDTLTGVSIMRMEEGLDTGPFALQRTVPIADHYACDVESELAEVGALALLEVLESIGSGTVRWTPQDESLATYARKISKDDVSLTPDISTEEAYRRVRAATRRAPARACVGDRELTIVRATPMTAAQSAHVAPGAVCVVDGCPVLGLADGGLRLDTVRPAGRQDMEGAGWARGARLTGEVCWRCTR